MSASIFQAVVNQTISGLACGKPIKGHVAFLGGPLHFLSELKSAFIRTLNLDDEHTIVPENSHLFAAIGSALNYKLSESVSETESELVPPEILSSLPNGECFAVISGGHVVKARMPYVSFPDWETTK